MPDYDCIATIKEIHMFRKLISSLFLAVTLLTAFTLLAAAKGGSQVAYQMDMGTPTAASSQAATPVSDMPLTGSESLPLTETQTGTCPMMGSMDMTGMGMSGMSMGDMSGAGMNGMSGMQGMSGMNMPGMNGMMAYQAVPWYSNPWWILGWMLVVAAGVAFLFGAVLGIRWIVRIARQAPPVQITGG
jgi:hypothetical protein